MRRCLTVLSAVLFVYLLYLATPAQAAVPAARKPTKTPADLPTATYTLTATVESATPTSTSSPTFTATSLPDSTATATATATTAAATPTSTQTPTLTATMLPSSTATATAAAASPTSTHTPLPSATPLASPTPASFQEGVFYVTTGGSPSGDGSASRPWDLQTALSHPAAVKPGAVIWVRGGVYQGNFVSQLKGAQGAPVTLRAYPDERVTLMNGGGAPVLDIGASYYANIWGIEVTSSFSARTTSRSESSYGIRVNQGTSSHHVNFINIVVHDVLAQGIAWWQALSESDIYGSLIYYNGTTQLDHGIYVHNMTGVKRFIDNIVGDNAAYGYHGYASTSEKGLNNMQVTGNVLFNNGSIGYNTSQKKYGVYKRNILLGGTIKANDPLINNNSTYYPGSAGTSLNLGYNAGTNNAIVTGNYLMGGDIALVGANNNLVMTGNTVYAPGGYTGFNITSYPENNWLAAKPTGLKVFVAPNRYESNRANIVVYNWDMQNTVSVPSSSLGGIDLRPGQAYELRNGQDFYGDVITGVYDGNALILPMTGRSVAQPVGLNFKPASTFPEMGVFVLFAK